MPFPDQDYLNRLIENDARKIDRQQAPLERLLMLSGAAMNWHAEFFTDPSVTWSRETLRIADLTLTGTNPDWNAVIIDRAERSPTKLKALLDTDPDVVARFGAVSFDETPILIRIEEGKAKVLDGMHRVVAAIHEGRESIEAYVARYIGQPQPACEPHVIYDLLRAYHRGLNRDRASLITALRFLRKSYANVDALLRERFRKAWVPSDEIQAIIAEALQDT